jgi:hypothetical protein
MKELLENIAEKLATLYRNDRSDVFIVFRMYNDGSSEVVREVLFKENDNEFEVIDHFNTVDELVKWLDQ